MSEPKNILEWLPDWTDESAYPDPEHDSLQGKVIWAWEFYGAALNTSKLTTSINKHQMSLKRCSWALR